MVYRVNSIRNGPASSGADMQGTLSPTAFLTKDTRRHTRGLYAAQPFASTRAGVCRPSRSTGSGSMGHSPSPAAGPILAESGFDIEAATVNTTRGTVERDVLAD